MAHPGVDHLRPASRGAVAHAIAVGAKVGAALDHLARYSELRLPPVVAAVDSAAPRIAWMQQGLSTSAGWRSAYQSVVQSQTLPAMSYKPYPFGGKDPAGVVVP